MNTAFIGCNEIKDSGSRLDTLKDIYGLLKGHRNLNVKQTEGWKDETRWDEVRRDVWDGRWGRIESDEANIYNEMR